MSRIIIGVHGIGNKPPPNILRAWWKVSIREGLKKIVAPDTFFNFELVYWAHYLHSTSLKPGIKDADHPLIIEEPYFPAPKVAEPEKPSELRQKILDYVDEQLDKLFLNEDLSINYKSITDFIIHHFFSDLEAYYKNNCVKESEQDCEAKAAIESHLADVLKKHRRKKILLIAHSMGSIIAYDVLTRFARDVKIDTFVTIGSPLGLPIIKSKIIAESETNATQKRSLKTPENILRNWYNLSDLKDKIALNYRLHDDFEENSRHVQPVDKIVINNYEFRGRKNPHKSYGYLRTLEMAEIISHFLGPKRYHPLA